jgi:hypothetical protein
MTGIDHTAGRSGGVRRAGNIAAEPVRCTGPLTAGFRGRDTRSRDLTCAIQPDRLGRVASGAREYPLRYVLMNLTGRASLLADGSLFSPVAERTLR